MASNSISPALTISDKVFPTPPDSSNSIYYAGIAVMNNKATLITNIVLATYTDINAITTRGNNGQAGANAIDSIVSTLQNDQGGTTPSNGSATGGTATDPAEYLSATVINFLRNNGISIISVDSSGNTTTQTIDAYLIAQSIGVASSDGKTVTPDDATKGYIVKFSQLSALQSIKTALTSDASNCTNTSTQLTTNVQQLLNNYNAVETLITSLLKDANDLLQKILSNF